MCLYPDPDVWNYSAGTLTTKNVLIEVVTVRELENTNKSSLLPWWQLRKENKIHVHVHV